MKIRGIIAHCLNAQVCIRGFVKISEIAKFSKSNDNYQRNLFDLATYNNYTYSDPMDLKNQLIKNIGAVLRKNFGFIESV